MPIRPANLATMAATIADALAGTSAGTTVTVAFESGHRQVVEGGGCRILDSGQGGVVAIDTTAPTKYALFSGTTCQGTRAIASGSGSVTFDAPVLAGAIVLG